MAKAMYTPKQKKILNLYLTHAITARWNFFTGAVRSGKTVLTFYLLLHRIEQFPTGNMLLVAKTLGTLEQNVLDPMREMFGETLIGRVYGSTVKKVNIFGRAFYVRGANDKRSGDLIRGMTLCYVMGDEVSVWDEDFFTMLKSRLSDSGALADLTTNPESPNHWLKRFIDLPGLDMVHHHFVLDDNTFLGPAYIKALKTEYPEGSVWYLRFIKGLWVLAQGVIYSSFNRDLHIVDDLPVMQNYWIGADYGTSNPTVFILIGQAQDGRFYICKEYYHHGGKPGNIPKTDLEYSHKMIDFVKDINLTTLRVIMIDPSAASFKTQLFKLRDKCTHLKKVYDANNAVVDGIRKVATLMGSNRLLIHSSCVNTIDEISSYCWCPKAQETGKDKPIEVDDHAPDAIRYGVQAIFAKGYDRRGKAA